MPASLLFVAGDAGVQRQVFAAGRAYWSAGFDLVLEKHGVLDFDRRGFDVLGEPATLAAYPLLVIAWIPPDAWRDDYAAHLRAHAGAMVLEGPLPPALATALGLRQTVTTRREVELEVVTAELRAALAACPVPTPRADGLHLAPKQVETRPTVDTRWPAAGTAPQEAEISAAQIARTAWSSQILRLRRARPFAEPRQQLSMLVFLLAHPRGLPTEDRLAALATWQALDPADLPIASHDAHRAVGASLGIPSPRAAGGWWAKFAARWSGRASRATSDGVADDLEALAWCALGRLLWQRPFDTRAARVAVAAHWRADSARLPRPLSTLDVHRLVLVLLALDEAAAARALHARLLACAMNGATGVIANGRFDGEALAAGRGAVLDPLLPLTCALLYPAACAEPSGGAARDAYDARRRDAWQAPPFDLALLDARDGEVLAHVAGSPREAVLVRSERRLVWSFQALAAQVHFHTEGPLRESWQGCEPDDASALEALWFAALDAHARACGVSYLAVEPWPRNYRCALTVRHDVDRVPSAEEADRLLAWERSRALRASWYWIHDRLDPMLLRRLRDDGHEVALHGTALERKDAQLEHLRAEIGVDAVSGESLHGGGGDFWLGYPSVAAAAAAGLRYTEGVPSVMDFPYRFPVLTAAGEVIAESLLCLTHNHSVDDGVSRKRRHVRNAGVLAARRAAGHYLVLLNHPDLNFEALRALVEQLDDGTAWRATAAQVAQWWWRSHRREALDITRASGTSARFELRADTALDGLRVSLRGAAGGVSRVLDYAPGQVAMVDFGAAAVTAGS